MVFINNILFLPTSLWRERKYPTNSLGIINSPPKFQLSPCLLSIFSDDQTFPIWQTREFSHSRAKNLGFSRCVDHIKGHAGQLYIALTKISDKNNLEEEKFILVHSFRGLSTW
ncbi:hypothetical protein H1C71_004292 [Ictidomys tridecemlineatus]|nr:hypothetical protein H1C71_004292 [Ictidomys tridecemlineatus]